MPAAKLLDLVYMKELFTLRGLSKYVRFVATLEGSLTGAEGFVACCSSRVLSGRRGKCCPTNAAQQGKIRYQEKLTSAPSPVRRITQMCPFCLEEEPQVQKDKKGGY